MSGAPLIMPKRRGKTVMSKKVKGRGIIGILIMCFILNITGCSDKLNVDVKEQMYKNEVSRNLEKVLEDASDEEVDNILSKISSVGCEKIKSLGGSKLETGDYVINVISSTKDKYYVKISGDDLRVLIIRQGGKEGMILYED